MNKKAKAQLLIELAQLDVDRAAIQAQYDREHLCTDAIITQLEAFRDTLCEVLGIQEYTPYLEYLITDDPILGGDEGVTTTIYYQLGIPGEGTPFSITMAYEGLEVQYTAPTAVDLPVMLHRGYAALRVLRKGTTYFHKD